MTVFDAYSSYYDLLYRDKNYSAEAAYVLSLIRQCGTQPRTLLELGCGTGLHATAFAESGVDVTGVDISQTMLAKAEERRRKLPEKLQSQLTFSLGDIRTATRRRQSVA